MNSPSLISVIIPTLNEAGTVGPTLRRVQAQEDPFEILVVDGGSHDETRSIARSAGAHVLLTAPGRALQMNHGAENASGEVLLFLHADTLLPEDGLSTIRSVLQNPEVTSGTFRLRFDEPTPLLRFYAGCTRLPWIRLCFGDRGQFVRRSVFDEIGGFPKWPLFEDLEMADRLQQYGGFRFLQSTVTTSARRFRRRGSVRQQLRNLYLWTHYMLGTEPERVAHLYEYGDFEKPKSQQHS